MEPFWGNFFLYVVEMREKAIYFRGVNSKRKDFEKNVFFTAQYFKDNIKTYTKINNFSPKYDEILTSKKFKKSLILVHVLL